MLKVGYYYTGNSVELLNPHPPSMYREGVDDVRWGMGRVARISR